MGSDISDPIIFKLSRFSSSLKKKKRVRHITSDARCQGCHDFNEDGLHAVRDSKFVRELWKRLVNSRLRDEFF